MRLLQQTQETHPLARLQVHRQFFPCFPLLIQVDSGQNLPFETRKSQTSVLEGQLHRRLRAQYDQYEDGGEKRAHEILADRQLGGRWSKNTITPFLISAISLISTVFSEIRCLSRGCILIRGFVDNLFHFSQCNLEFEHNCFVALFPFSIKYCFHFLLSIKHLLLPL